MSKEILTPEDMATSWNYRLGTVRCGDFTAGVREAHKDVALAMLAALESPDPFPALRSLLSALSGQGTEEARDTEPQTEPGPTEGADVLIRAHYVWKMDGGYFANDRGEFVSAPTDVSGLSVRVVYTYHREAKASADDLAGRWKRQILRGGAKAVEMVGEER